MNIVALIQARVNSERFPNKVFEKIENEYLFEYLHNRVIKSKLINKTAFVIPNNKKNKLLLDEIKKKNYLVFCGDEKNVLNRYFESAKFFKADVIIRITGDCPLVDPNLLDSMLSIFLKKNLDYISNTEPPTFPDGFDIEIFKFKYLKKANSFAVKKYDKEHVTPYIKNIKKIKKANFKNNLGDYSNIRLTIDENDDLLFLKKIIKKLNKKKINFKEIIRLYKNNKSFFSNSLNASRNDGSVLQKGQKLWIKAKNIIAGNNMLFSKKSELFLPRYWPAYYKKTTGCKVTDLNGNTFLDLSLMGVGTNILGYSNSKIDNKVIQVIKDGNMSTLNSPDEVELAERLLDINKWADQVKFTRTGAEASSVALRLARAASGKDNIAFCGYHGWHDWYLASQLNNPDALEKSLMPDLQTKGVPKFLKGTSFPFKYNNINDLIKIIATKNIGAIIMEVSRNAPPENNFLLNVKKIAKKSNIILIFDECSSGFRETYGGINIKYKVNPDVTIFGKALGNGYAINAVIGDKNVMKNAENTFISSTFWTERIGYVAGISTLKEMKRIKSWEIISGKGDYIKKEWQKIADRYKLDITITGLRPMISFKFNYPEHNILKTFITQEMLKDGFLASNTIYVSIAHTDKVIKKYLYSLEKIFYKISKYESYSEITKNLISKYPSQSTFKRLN